jgi:adenylate cyclase class IV
MIEVEKKFRLQTGGRERLLNGAQFIGKEVHTDTYYDTLDWKLTRTDKWLRKRNSAFELKASVSFNPAGNIATSEYYEFETDGEIAEQLGFKIPNGLEASLLEHGLVPFATIVTTREKYTKEGFALDFDSADFGFEILEIELMVASEAEAPGAVSRITHFAETNGLTVRRTRGKLLEYIYRYNPDHYKVLFPNGDGF